MHKLLARQLRRCFGSQDCVPAGVLPLIDLINQTYADVDHERALLERSMMIASEELHVRNLALRNDQLVLQQTLDALREETRTTESLSRIAQAITGELDLKILMPQVIELATSAVNADFGMLCCDASVAKSGKGRLHSVAGPLAESASKFCFSFGLNGGTELVSTLERACINDTSCATGTDFTLDLCATARSGGLLSLLISPLRGRNGSIIGVVLFGHTKRAAFKPKDERLIDGITSHASVAIENARLFLCAQEANERLAHQAMYDALTGLPSRVLFRNRLEEALSRTRADHSRSCAVMFVDLDRFKAVNDNYGHETGDHLLRMTSHRLLSCIRNSQVTGSDFPPATVARLGGDEFTVILEGFRDAAQLADIAQQIIDQLSTPFAIGGNELDISASVGIACATPATANIDELLQCADAAMYHAKGGGKDRYAVYDAQVHASVQARNLIEDAIPIALEREEFFLLYQPITCLSTRKLVGFEALIRWRRDGQIINPAEFIPIAEQSNLIVDIGKWVIDRACRQYDQWHRRIGSAPGVTMSVNLSRRQLVDSDIVAYVASCLQKYNVPPHNLKLEITESMVMQDMERSIATLEALRGLGVGLQMDDFGTGHSSLAYLSSLPLDGLKIDRMFIRNISYRRDCLAILQAIITLAHNLKIAVVAEGIEEPEQVVLLQALDCDYAQGFYFARPLDPEAAFKFIEAEYVPLALHNLAA